MTKENKKPKVLLLMQLPPPVHGASMMNRYVQESQAMNNCFQLRILPLKFVTTVADIGKFSIKKVLLMVSFAIKLFFTLIAFRPKLVYLTLSPVGFAFYRDVFFITILKLFRRRIIYHLHGKGIHDMAFGSSLKKRIYRYAFHNVQVIHLAKNLLSDLKGVYEKSSFIVPNGIPEIPDAAENDSGTKKDMVNILYLSNLIEEKGILILLEALKQLSEKKITFSVNIVGKEADVTYTDLQNKIEHLRLGDKVFIKGPKYDGEKHEEFRKADIFVFPTYYANECFPLVILEAMQFALPVVSTYEGGIPEIIENGKEGFLAKQKDPKDLALQLEKLISDESLRADCGKKAKAKFLKNYTLKSFESQLVSVLRQSMK